MLTVHSISQVKYPSPSQPRHTAASVLDGHGLGGLGVLEDGRVVRGSSWVLAEVLGFFPRPVEPEGFFSLEEAGRLSPPGFVSRAGLEVCLLPLSRG